MRDLFEEVYIILKGVGQISITEFSIAIRMLIQSIKNR